MTITSGLILYAVTWFMTFYITLQLRTRTQAEAGHVVPGTPASAPAQENVGRSALITTGFATVIWAALTWVIVHEWITTEDLDFNAHLFASP